MQSYANEDGEFCASIEAVDVLGGVGFSEAQLLRLAQRGGEGNAVAFDLRKDVIAGAVQDSADLEQFIARQALLETRDHRHSSGHGCAELDLLIHLAGQGDQFRTAVRDQLLIRRNHRFTGSERGATPVFGGWKAADYFDENVGV